MNTHALFDELQKIAVSMAETREAMKRIDPHLFLGRGANAFPTMAQMKTRAKQLALGQKKFREMFPDKLLPRVRTTQELVESHIKNLQREGPPGLGMSPGSISVGMFERHLPTSTLHEQFERAVKPHLSTKRFYTHGNPEVLIKEHNMLSRLRGRGAKQVRAEHRALRRQPWDPEDVEFGMVPGRTEEEGLRNLFVQQFGPRAAQFLREGRKVPKAMRKRVAENWMNTQY